MDTAADGPASGDRGAPAGAPPVAGVLLAAGVSARMGSNKLLLELDGESLLRRAARTALAAGLSPLVVVLGHEADRGQAALRGLPCATALNPDHGLGQGRSLAVGLGALPASAGAAVVLLADMPLVTAAMISALVDRWRATGAPLVLCDYQGVLAPPALYARALFGELAGSGEAPGKQVLARHRAAALTVPCPAAALADVDRPGDLAPIEAASRRTP